MRIKVFRGYTSYDIEFEQEVNDWLATVNKPELIDIIPFEYEDDLGYDIFFTYSEVLDEKELGNGLRPGEFVDKFGRHAIDFHNLREGGV